MVPEADDGLLASSSRRALLQPVAVGLPFVLRVHRSSNCVHPGGLHGQPSGGHGFDDRASAAGPSAHLWRHLDEHPRLQRYALPGAAILGRAL